MKWSSLKKLSLFVLGLTLAPLGFSIEPGSFHTRGSADQKALALSFDDGPGPYTEKMLAVLKEENVKATFFMQGNQVSWRKPLAKKVAEDGHEIASHLWNHVNYRFRLRDLEKEMPAEEALEKTKMELDEAMAKTQKQIKETTGVEPNLLRMPHGIDRPWIYPIAKKHGLAAVNWTYGADWTPVSAEEMAKGYVKAIKPGAILLFHDGGSNRAKTVEVLKATIVAAKAEGYSFLTVGDLLSAEESAQN